MAALTETSSNVTEFSGKFKVAAVEVDGATGTTGSVTIDEMDTVVAVFAQMKEAPTATCAHVRASINATTANQIDCILYEDDHVTACTQTATDFYLLAVGY
ncbi:MAG: hypothetical protein DRJ03_03560 [Chloroflexi bacterium]|nr:MAG: hypothetical protein DRJ03_03560 [Chloroflexota bacterium]